MSKKRGKRTRHPVRQGGGSPAVEKAIPTAAEKAERAAMIKGFRETKRWTREVLAERLGLDGVTAVYAWERAAYEPSAETYVRLANWSTGAEWKYMEWFLSRAGLDLRTLEQVADMLPKGRALPSDENIAIYSLQEPREVLSFPRALIANEASTRFVRLRESFRKRLRQGDMLLIDTLETDPRDLGEDCFVAVNSGKDNDPEFGFLSEQNASVGEIPVSHFMLKRLDGGDLFLGSSTGSRPPDLIRENIVLGRVVAWSISTREPRTQRRKK